MSSDIVTELGELLESVGARVTFDPDASIVHPCFGCDSSDYGRTLVVVGVWIAGPLRGGSIRRPMCATCAPVVTR